jgi:WS/DGAT/MGAT family acyltransferase
MIERNLDPLDSAFITLEVPSAPLHIGAIIELDVHDDLDPRERYEKIKSLIGSRIHEIPVLTQRIVRTPFDLAWPAVAEDPEFDLDAHVIRRAVPFPGGDEELDAVVGRVMSRELPPDRPLWELNVLEGLADGRMALIMKIHHALVDGVAGATTFAKFFDITPEVREPEPKAGTTDQMLPALPTPMEMLSRTAGEILRRPGAFVEAVTAGVEKAAETIERLALHGSDLDDSPRSVSVLQAVRTSINGTPSYSKGFTRLCLDLGAVKGAAKERGAKVTDFVMATVSGGLKRLFDERGEELTRDLVAFVPINVRRDGTEGDMGNQISAMLVALRTDVEDPEERLKAIADTQAHSARRQKEQNAKLLMNLASAAGPTLMSAAGRTLAALELFDHLPPAANVVVSSVPGPPIPLWLNGYEMAHVAPFGPLMAGLSLNITVLGYSGNLEYGILACTRRIPEFQLLKEYIAEEAQFFLKNTYGQNSFR